MAERHGFSAEIIDLDQIMQEEDWANTDFLSSIKRHLEGIKTNIFGITTVCSNYAIALLIANTIKEIHPTSKVILGGVQASLVPLETLEAFPAVDLIVCGEGEITLVELLKSDFNTKNLQRISGLAIRVEGKPALTSKRKLIKNLDDLPPPNFNLLSIKKYYTEEFLNNERLVAGVIEAGRGCPFNCAFCSTSVMWERQFRTKSPKRILDEMKNLNDLYGFNRFNLIHDNLTTDPKYLQHFCDYFQNNNPGLKWVTNSRVDCINEQRLEKMAASGCHSIFFGVESASPRIQQKINKPINLQKFPFLLEKCVQLGINTIMGFMIGFPDETIEEIENTLLTSVKYRNTGLTNMVLFNKVAALAATRIFEEQSTNLILHKTSSSFHSIFPNIPEVWELTAKHPYIFSSSYTIPNKNISDEELNGLLHLFSAGVRNHPGTMYDLLYSLGYKPMTLLDEWLSWCIKRYNRHPKSNEEAEILFPNFLQDINSALETEKSPFLLSADIFAPDEEESIFT